MICMNDFDGTFIAWKSTFDFDDGMTSNVLFEKWCDEVLYYNFINLFGKVTSPWMVNVPLEYFLMLFT